MKSEKTHPFLFSFLQWTFGILQTLIGFFVFSALKIRDPKRKCFRFREAIVTEWGQGGSMSLGAFLFLGQGAKSNSEFVLRHEYGHSIQSMILGPFYLPVIGIPSFLRANVPFFSRNWRSGRTGYYAFYPERWANSLGHTDRRDPV